MAIDIKGAVQSDQTYALFNPLDLYQTEVYSKLVKKVPYMSSLSWMKMLKGRMTKRKSKRHVYSFYEEGQFMKAACTVLSVAANGAKLDVTLSPGDHSDIGGAGATSFVVENQFALLGDGKTSAFVESILRTAGAHVVTIKKFSAGDDIATPCVAGSTIVFYSNGQPESSTETESRVPQFEKITNVMQEIREGFNVTDFEVQNAAWFEAESGKKYLWYKGNSDTFQRFEFQSEGAMLQSTQSSGLTDKNSKSVQSMYGLLPQIEQHGTVLEYFNSPDMDSFDEVMLALDNAYGDKEYIVGHGTNLMLKLKNFLVEFAKNGTGNISFSPFDGGESQAISLRFKSYSVGAYNFYFQNWDIFSHKDSFGAPGMPHRHFGVFIPAGMTRDADPDRADGNPEYVPYMQMVTPDWGVPIPANVDKGDYLMWETGALANGGPTSDKLHKKVHMVRYAGWEMRCRNKFLKWEKA